MNGSNGTNGSSGSSGSSGTSATSAVKVYQVTLSYTSNVMDAFPTGLVSASGPNGENLATLQTAGWVFSKVDSTTLSVTRPSGLQFQPLVNIMTHGVNGTSVWSKSPTGVANTSLSAMQTLSSGNYTTLTLYGLNSANTGLVSSGATTLTITFGLLS